MKYFLKSSLVLAVAALALQSCNSVKQMAQPWTDKNVTAAQDALTLNNGVVSADVNVNFPSGYVHKNAIVKVTPVLVFDGGEIAGTPKYYQGTNVDDNYTVVGPDGGNYTQHVEFPYDPRMENKCDLQLRTEIKMAKDDAFTPLNMNTGELATKEEAAILAGTDEAAKAALLQKFSKTVVSGVNTMQKDLKFESGMAVMPNNYKKVSTVVNKTDLRYAINSSAVTKKNEKAANFDDFKADVESKLQNDRATQHVAVKGYASPDGPEKLNDKLSKARSESGKAVVAKLLKDSGLEVDAAAYGEDWDGFKELVEQSNIKDKNLILQVLSLYNSSSQRESEIKNLAAVFEELKSEVLPELRRAQVINTTDIEGKTDAELLAAAKSAQPLTVEEYLYTAENLAANPAEQAAILSAAAKRYNDARVWNNLGVAQAANGQTAEALASFKKAGALSTSKEITKNLLLANLANGNTAEAKKYSAAADAETKAALAAATGDYKSAVNNLTGYNKAVAAVMNNDLATAKRAIANDKSADADYLRAVIAAKEGDLTAAAAQLRSAVSKDPSLAAKAAKDVNLKALNK